MEEEVVEFVVGDEDVHPAVEVEIGNTGAHPLSRVRADARLGRDIPESPVAVIEKQLVGGLLIEFRIAVVPPARCRADRLRADVPAQVVDHKQIEQPVVVDIDPRGADRPERAVLAIGLIDFRLFGHVGEGAVSVVAIEPVAMDAADKEVLVAVVVVVADGGGCVVAAAGQAGLLRDIRKMALAIVGKQPVGVLGRGLLQRSDIGAVGEEDVQVAVVVVVEDRDPAGHGLRRVPLRCLTNVERESDRPIDKVDGRFGRHTPPQGRAEKRGQNSNRHCDGCPHSFVPCSV